VPDYIVGEPDINLWFGPADTVSPPHTDPQDNLFLQIQGYKYIRLWAPDAPHMFPHDGLMKNTSQVDPFNIHADQAPFSTMHYEDTIVGPGEYLFIPKGHWHYVR